MRFIIEEFPVNELMNENVLFFYELLI